MLIGVLADTHDEIVRTRLAVQMLKAAGVARLVHCGDLTNAAIVEICSELPFSFCFGNHDADMVPHLEAAARKYSADAVGWQAIREWHGRRVGFVHGHLTHDLKEVCRDQPDVLLTGHTHQASIQQFDAILRVNPGALHRASRYTVATMNLDTLEVTFLDVGPQPALSAFHSSHRD